MQFVIQFPEFSPNIVVFGWETPIRWYALAYIAGLVFGWWYVRLLMKRPKLWGGKPPMTPAQPEDLLTWMVLGVVLGGRLGFILFYQLDYYREHPLEILMVWQGGMAFHGGFLGVILAILIWSTRARVNPVRVGDAVAAATPVGIFLGRIANFINGELWGRPTTVSWGMIFPDPASSVCPPGWEGPCARHPSQLYEAALEGFLLMIVISWLVWRRGWLKRPGAIIGVFFLGYGLGRTFVEGFRQADLQFVTDENPWGHIVNISGSGYDAVGLTMGQLLSLPMVVIGAVILYYRWPRKA